MSINVNVTGKCVSTRSGTKVAADPDFAKKEFQKRRRIRLEQVRQQSKDIAEDVRNKVRKEKTKQLSNLEKQGEQELKRWQARKLLALQQQYQECLKDIGLGHMQAVMEEDSDQASKSRKESYGQIARERGERAVQRLQKDKQQELISKSASFQRKKYNQSVENTRAALVANLSKNKVNSPFKKKKRRSFVGDSNKLADGSASETEMPELLNLSGSNPSSRSCSPSAKFKPETSRHASQSPISHELRRFTIVSDKQNKEEQRKANEEFISPLHKQEYGTKTFVSFPVDTRISDRINKRRIKSAHYEPHNNICDNDIPDENLNSKSQAINDNSVSSRKYQNANTASNLEQSTHNSKKSVSDHKTSADKDLQTGIPIKPTITLRSVLEGSDQLKPLQQLASAHPNLNKVQYYDHKNRYFKEYVPDNSSVQKIDVESLEVRASTESEAEFVDQMYKRDRVAEARGQKALEKLKVRRDYREMMQQLPILQRQERIASIPSHKTTFHMSGDRLKEHGRKKQNRLENAYETLFPKPQVVTIPPKIHGGSITADLPFQTYNFKDNPPVINVGGAWDFDAKQKELQPRIIWPQNIESDLIREAMKKIPEVSSDADRRGNLEEMLHSITSQRDKLAQELSSLPEGSHLHQLFGQLGNIDQVISVATMSKGPTGSTQRQRSRQSRRPDRAAGNKNKVSSSSLSPSYRLIKSPKEARREHPSPPERERKISKYHVHCTSASSSSPSPPTKIATSAKSKSSKASRGSKKSKSKKPPIVLQNTSTQTQTPVVETVQSNLSKAQSTTGSGKDEQKQPPLLGVPSGSQKKELIDELCKCCRCAAIGKNETCEIVIKAKDSQEQQLAQSKPVAAKATSTTQVDKGRRLCAYCAKNKETCEIVIKITEDGKPQICLSPTKLKDNKIVVTTMDVNDSLPSRQPKPKVKESDMKTLEEPVKCTARDKPTKSDKPKTADKQKVKDAIQKSKDQMTSVRKKSGVSWREQLSRNSNNSSTSYYSPPVPAVPRTQDPKPVILNQKPCGYFTNILGDKPQQVNVHNESAFSTASFDNNRTLDSYLTQHVKKLLMMSRRSIDDLTVSSISELSTPGSSIVNVPPNLSSSQFEHFVKHLNMNLTDIEQMLSYSADGSNVHYNTSESTTLSLRSDTNAGQQTRKPRDAREMTIDEYTAENYPGVLVAYNKLAENCAKKIESLAAMIEKVRLDKLSILQSPGSGSDKENSTKYMDLPAEPKNQNDENKSVHSDSTAEQEELNRQLLEIDYSFAEQLKKMTSDEIRLKYPLSSSSSSSVDETEGSQDAINQQLIQRFRNLLDSHKNENIQSANSPDIFVATQTENIGSEPIVQEPLDEDVPFVPFLNDIPRLPKFDETNCSCRATGKSKPPTSKGLSVARRFNSDINIIPHELSTIMESEASRLQRSKTPPSKEASPVRRTEERVIPLIIAEPIDSDDGTKPKTPSSDSLPDILIELTNTANNQVEDKRKRVGSHQKPSIVSVELVSDSSTSDLETMEAMLQSLGMGWAVATLRKTQEALALTSSSSSIDISLRQKEIRLTDSSSTSEISMKDLLTKLSSSTVRPDDSNSSSPFTKELQNISAIQGSGTSHEKTNVRTSTPVQTSKTNDKSKTSESELSSVKAYSDDYLNSAPFYSLNEDSSIKSGSGSKSN